MRDLGAFDTYDSHILYIQTWLSSSINPSEFLLQVSHWPLDHPECQALSDAAGRTKPGETNTRTVPRAIGNGALVARPGLALTHPSILTPAGLP